LNGVADK